MNDSVSKAVQKIARMRAQFSDEEIIAAMRQILNHGFPEKKGPGYSARNNKRRSASNRSKTLAEGVSRAVLDVEKSDPEKYEILSRVDRLLRKRDILRDMRSLRDFGQSLDKSFEPGKSRKDAVPRLVQVLSEIPIDRLALVVEEALEKEREREAVDDDYRRLANYLMSKKGQ